MYKTGAREIQPNFRRLLQNVVSFMKVAPLRIPNISAPFFHVAFTNASFWFSGTFFWFSFVYVPLRTFEAVTHRVLRSHEAAPFHFVSTESNALHFVTS